MAIAAGGVREQVLGVVEDESIRLPSSISASTSSSGRSGCSMTSSVRAVCRSTSPGSRSAASGTHQTPVGEIVGGLGGGLEREPRLSGASGARQREQPDAVPQLLDHVGELMLAAEELRRRDREVRERGACAAVGIARPQAERAAAARRDP